MEPRRPEPPPDEVLSTGHDPGALERWAGALTGRRWVRAAAGGALAALLVGGWLAHGSREPGSEEAGGGAVAPGETVSVRCTDITHYGGTPARVARWTVNVTTVPCAEGRRQPRV